MQPKVSVVIPCYNHAIYLSEAVASVMAQTYDNWECLIINDGSPDHTETIGKQLANSDPRIHYHYKPNGGLSNARNFGIEKAKGEFILTLDADDTFEPVFLQEAVAILEQNDSVGVVTCWGYRFENNKKYGLFKPIGGNVENFLFFTSALASSLFRKKCWEQIGGYDETMRKGYEDWEFYLRLTSFGWSVQVIEKPLFNYRQHKNSMRIEAQNLYDLEIKQYFFKKHKNLYLKYFDQSVDYLLKQAEKNKKNEIKRITSIDFKIGKAILKPFRWIKKLLKNE